MTRKSNVNLCATVIAMMFVVSGSVRLQNSAWGCLTAEDDMTRSWIPDAQPPIDANLPTLFLIGDSTVKTGKGVGENGQWGWGAPVAEYFNRKKINVDNRALGGRSSRTYQTEGLWDKVLADIKPDDFVMMQFGHNDGGALDDNKRARGTIQGIGDETREIDNPITGRKEVVHTYGWYMRKYINDTKAKKAIPIVCSLIPRNIWEDGKVVRASNDYGKWAAEVAKAEGAFFIDLNGITARHYEQIGQEKVSAAFFGQTDHTHTTAAGAKLNAESVIEGIKSLKNCSLESFLTAIGHKEAQKAQKYF